MKFGRNFYDRQVPEWADAYVDYDELKERVRSTNNAPPDLEATIQAAVQKVDEFAKQQHTLVKTRLYTVVDHFNLWDVSTRAKELEGASGADLLDLVAALEGIGRTIADLDLYSKINHDACDRITSKAGGPNLDAKTVTSPPWASDLLLVNNLLRSAAQVRVKLAQSQQPKSENKREKEPFKKDFRGRNALHYAVESGSAKSVGSVLTLAQQDGVLAAALATRDDAGRSPVHIAVRRGDVEVFELLLSTLKSRGDESVPEEAWGAFLVLAIRLGHETVARALIEAGKGLEYQEEHGETPLQFAARAGRTVAVKALLAAKAKVDVEESTRGWSPLLTACAGGHLEIVQMLLQAGASQDKLDRRGWSAIDHAAYRGYPKVVEALQGAANPSGVGLQNSTTLSRVGASTTSTSNRPTVPTGTAGTKDLALKREPDKCHIYANLGTFNLYKKVTTVDVEPYLDGFGPEVIPESFLWLEVASLGCDTKKPYLQQLPILEDLTNDPWHFTAASSVNAKLVFKIYNSIKGDLPEVSLVGTGIAVLGSLTEALGSERESLVRDFKIPLVGDGGDYMGAITVTFVVSRPLKSAHSPPTVPQSMLPTPKTQVGGHRGLGQNNKKQQHLQIGENTLQSFESAITLGAAFVEFDVQVTKDGVPVIYHDFLVSEAGTDATMHTISYSQFMAISDAQSGVQKAPGPERLPWDERARPTVRQLRRSRSLCRPVDTDTAALLDRMQHTFEGANSGFVKPNTRSKHIHEPFITLRDMFEKLPETVSFDMEIKYPMLYEAADFQMDIFAMELNKFLDSILDIVYECARGRSLFFTSFSPEVCMLLATKQTTYPILFLNDSSNWPTGDSRALSTQTAVHFARRWGLQGVVMASEPFVAAPKLASFIRGKGLYSSSYGAQNDDPEMAKIQANAHLDSIIVNDVHLISKALE